MEIIPYLGTLKAAIGVPATFWLLLWVVASLLTVYSVYRISRSPPHNLRSMHVNIQALVMVFMPGFCLFLTQPAVCEATEDTPTTAAHGCYALEFSIPLFFVVLFTISLMNLQWMSLQYLLMEKVATWRGERKPWGWPEDTAYEAVTSKADKYTSFIKVRTDDRSDFSAHDGKTYTVIQYHDKFVESLRDLNDTNGKDVSWLPPQHILDLLFFHGLRKVMDHNHGQHFRDWTKVLCQQYTIGGIGCGPELSIEGMVDLAEQELALPQLEYTVTPGSLPQAWRFACVLFSSIWTPVLIEGALVHAYLAFYWVS